MTAICIHPGCVLSLIHPEPALIDLDDIADGLRERRRYGPLMRHVHWTVAQHTVLVMMLCGAEARPYAALHDAPEHYLGDDVTPKKQALLQLGRNAEEGRIAYEVYRRLEDRVAKAIHIRAGLRWPVPADIAAEVEAADHRAYNAEIDYLIPSAYRRAFVRFDDVDPVPRDIFKAASRIGPSDAAATLKAAFAKLLPKGAEAKEVPFA